jgi:hypothetical protein
MKLVKLSLATIIAMSSSVFGADTLEDAFKNGSINGEARAFLFSRDYGNKSVNTDNDMLAVGLRLSYETEELKGFKIGLGFQGQSTPWASIEAKADHQMPFDMGATGAVMSEAYLAYSMNKTDIKVGRQYFDKPLMISDNSRLIRQAIEGVTVVNTDIPDTTVYAAYAWAMQWMKGYGNEEFANFDDFGFVGPVGDYAYVIGAMNKSVKDLDLTLAYGVQDNSHRLLLAQADYTPMIGDIKLVTGLQYWNTEIDGTGDVLWADSTIYAAKLGVEVGPLSGYVAYADLQDGTGAWGVGMLDDRPRLYTSTIVDAGIYDASEQFAINLQYVVMPMELVLGTRYVDIDVDENAIAKLALGGDETHIGGYAAKHFGSGTLKGFTCVVIYEQLDSDTGTNDKDELRVRLSYEF